MKFSLNWLQEYLGLSLNADEIVHQLTMAGLEVDKTNTILDHVSDIYVGSVKQVKPHPSADKLKVCMVDVGRKDLLQIVCGASNVRVGMHAPVAVVGARIGKIEIKEQTLRQVASSGMLCSAGELGLSEEGDGLLELEQEIPAGTDFVDYLWLNDTVIELDLTPNRADCFSIIGIAREVSVFTDIELEEIRACTIPVSDREPQAVALNVVESKACPRYLSRMVTGLNTKAKTPIDIKERLHRSGVRPIHPVVDVMNYVMMELGQPMHAFDMKKVSGAMTVRFAHADEKITLLENDKQIALNQDTLVISDQKQALAIAGVMGGKDSAVSEQTDSIIIECAFFAPTVIIGKARSYGLHTESSKRFERGVDFCLQRRAMEYACELLSRICGGMFNEITEVLAEEHLPQTKVVELQWEEMNKRLGLTIDRKWITKTLKQLQIETKSCKGGWLCTIPAHRFDLAIAEDLIEEIGRVYGYDRIPSHLPSMRYLSESKVVEKRQLIKQWCDRLVFAGYLEVITYSFSDPDLLTAIKPGESILVNNPVSPALSAMRTSLWVGLLKTLLYNLNHQQTRLRIFEVGNQFANQNQGLEQSLMLAGLVYGEVYPEQWGLQNKVVDFYDLKCNIEHLLLAQFDQVTYLPDSENPALHPNKAARIVVEGHELGYLGALNPELEQIFDLPEGVLLFELDLDKLPVQKKSFQYQPLSRYPSVRRDLSLIMPRSMPVADLLVCIDKDKPKHLQNVFIFDIYMGKQVQSNEKSVALGFIFQDFLGTISEEMIEKHMSAMSSNLSQKLDITIRRK